MRYYEKRRDYDPDKDYDWDNDGFPGEYVYGDDVYAPEDCMDEVWKPVRGFRDYWISNHGRLYSSQTKRFIYGTPIGRCGHIDVSLKRDGVRYHRYLHRLVAEAFVENPHNLPVVRHLDSDPSYNDESNLEWGTAFDNVHDCIDSGRFRYLSPEDIEKANAVRRTPVVSVNLNTGKKLVHSSQQEASRYLGIHQSSIYKVLCGKSRHAGGYYFYYEDDPKEIDVAKYRYSRKYAPIRAINLETGESSIFIGQMAAARAVGISPSLVCNILGGKIYQAKGYTFEYAEDGYGE